jgi:protease PrsW
VALMAGLLISFFAAVIPTVIYTLIFYWADRYEREPKSLLAAAFLWGALPAIVASLILELTLGSPFVDDPGSLAESLMEGAVVAPIVEEVTKAFALWAIFAWRRHDFDGVLDGIVYGALIGFGFAMTENFFYFVGAFDEGGFVQLTIIIILRAVIFGLNHAFYTSLTGIGFGLARHTKRSFLRVLWPSLGLCGAIFVHGLHNFGASITQVNAAGILLTLAVAACGFALLVVVIILAWQQERRHMRSQLAEEVGILLTAAELELLVKRWRQPLRPGRPPHALRMQLLAHLALRKHRLRTLGVEYEPGLDKQVDQMRGQLAQMHAART